MKTISARCRFLTFLILASIVSSCATHRFSGGGEIEILHSKNISAEIAKLGGLPKSTMIQGVSEDGSVIVGQFRVNTEPYEWHIFRYVKNIDILDLGNFGKTTIVDFGTFDKKAIGNICLSADGLVIAGTFYVEKIGTHIFRYTPAHGFQDLGLIGDKADLAAGGLSADGKVIVGSFLDSMNSINSPLYGAFKYSDLKGLDIVNIAMDKSSFARGISANGSFIVGNSHTRPNASISFSHRESMFIYSITEGVQNVDTNGAAIFPIAVSNDGSVIVGSYPRSFKDFFTSYNYDVFVYSQQRGFQKLHVMGGQSAQPYNISADGTKFSGSYKDFFGESHAFVAKINWQEANDN